VQRLINHHGGEILGRHGGVELGVGVGDRGLEQPATGLAARSGSRRGFRARL
jgi:hypothetical protein